MRPVPTSPEPHAASAEVATVVRVGSRPHGVRGEVTVEMRTDEPERRFAPGVGAVPTTTWRPLTGCERSRWHSGRLLVHFAGVDDRTAAEALRGPLLHRADRPGRATRTDPEEFYDHQLIGLGVDTSTATASAASSRSCTCPARTSSSCDADDGARCWSRSWPRSSPVVDVRRPHGHRSAGRAAASCDAEGLTHADRRRHDLPRVLRAAEPVAARQGPVDAG